MLITQPTGAIDPTTPRIFLFQQRTIGRNTIGGEDPIVRPNACIQQAGKPVTIFSIQFQHDFQSLSPGRLICLQDVFLSGDPDRANHPMRRWPFAKIC